MKICIIDDDFICRLLTQKLFERASDKVQISHFINGMKAFEFFAKHSSQPHYLPELIILDINMPVANGWQFLDMLVDLDITGYYPTIYISSSSVDSTDLKLAGQYSLVRGYLPKPMTSAMVADVLEATSYPAFAIGSYENIVPEFVNRNK